MAAACRTVEEDETREAAEEARKTAAKRQGGKKQGEDIARHEGLVMRLRRLFLGAKKQGAKSPSLARTLTSFGGTLTGLVHGALDDLAGVGDDFDEEAGRGGTGTSEVIAG